MNASNPCATSATRTLQLTACRSLLLEPGAEETGGTSYTVYPNPFSDHIVIAYNSEQPKTISVVLYNALGETVWSGRQVINAGNGSFEAGFSDLKAGVYMIELQDEAAQKVTHQRIIKQ